jgi:malate synthase
MKPGSGAVGLCDLQSDGGCSDRRNFKVADLQWLKFGATLDTGQRATRKFFDRCMREEMKRVRQEVGVEAYQQGRFKEAISIFKAMSTSKDFEIFLTLPAYKKII